MKVNGKVAEITIDDNGISIILNNNMEAINCTIDSQYEDRVKEIDFHLALAIKKYRKRQSIQKH